MVAERKRQSAAIFNRPNARFAAFHLYLYRCRSGERRRSAEDFAYIARRWKTYCLHSVGRCMQHHVSASCRKHLFGIYPHMGASIAKRVAQFCSGRRQRHEYALPSILGANGCFGWLKRPRNKIGFLRSLALDGNAGHILDVRLVAYSVAVIAWSIDPYRRLSCTAHLFFDFPSHFLAERERIGEQINLVLGKTRIGDIREFVGIERHAAGGKNVTVKKLFALCTEFLGVCAIACSVLVRRREHRYFGRLPLCRRQRPEFLLCTDPDGIHHFRRGEGIVAAEQKPPIFPASSKAFAY